MQLSVTGLARLRLNIAVFLFGFTAILGKLISINAIAIVFWRMFFALGFLLLYKMWHSKNFDRLTLPIKLKLFAIGCIIALHWFCFYGSVKLSHVSVALICMALTPLFTALIEPFILKQKMRMTDLWVSVAVTPLIYFMIGGILEFQWWGFILGVLTALLAAVFSVLNKASLGITDSETFIMYEFLGVFIFSAIPMAYLLTNQPLNVLVPLNVYDLIYMLVLSYFCTHIAFKLTIKGMKHVSAFETNLIIGLEPLYGILMAVFIFKEYQHFSAQFYFASICILGIVILYPIYRLKNV
ncbi:MAG: DMT family transporter [Saprospiraceae bacterium]|nr:DMT family transporter [Saprospiraceae bacterium]MBK8849834.1 DMT family transporter [Saprospiraceae bacterium]